MNLRTFTIVSILILITIVIAYRFYTKIGVDKGLPREQKAVTYYPNGKLASEFIYKNINPIGDAYYYDEIGNIKKFQFFDERSNLRYDCLINLNSRITEHNGKSFFLKIDKSKKKIIDSIYIYPELIFPPNYYHSFEILIKTKNEVFKYYEKKYSKSSNQPFFKHSIKNDSITDFVFISKLFSADSIFYSSDTIIFHNYMKNDPR